MKKYINYFDARSGIKSPNFNAEYGKWFDRLVDYHHEATAEKTILLYRLFQLAKRKATHRNLDEIAYYFLKLDNAELSRDIFDFACAIVENKFKSEFRLRYSRNKNEVSATSEFFSMVRQALTYPNYKLY